MWMWIKIRSRSKEFIFRTHTLTWSWENKDDNKERPKSFHVEFILSIEVRENKDCNKEEIWFNHPKMKENYCDYNTR